MNWKQYPLQSKFYVSDTGEVSKHINIGNKNRPQWKPLKQQTNSGGYKYVSVMGKQQYVHRLVFITHVGPLLDGLVISHIDGNPSNNHVSNLEQVTQKENCARKKSHGTYTSKSKHHRSQYSDDQIGCVKKLLKTISKHPSGRIKNNEYLRIEKETGVLAHSVKNIYFEGSWV